MSKQEIYAWTSLLSSIAILGFYGITVYGLPDSLSGIESDLTSLFVKVFLFAFVVELAIGLFRSKDQVEKDERDYLIAGRGFRNAYYFLNVGLIVLISQIALGQFIENAGIAFTLVNILHMLIGSLLIASMINRATQIYFYQKM
jgi:hypothetical protein